MIDSKSFVVTWLFEGLSLEKIILETSKTVCMFHDFSS